MNELTFLKPLESAKDLDEWNRAWALVFSAYPEEKSGTEFEEWQYMGTAKGCHEFRHRDYQGRRLYHRVVDARS